MSDDSTTTALVLDAQRGDTRARDRLVAHHLPLVYNIAGRALGGGHADVDDIVQDTFIRALTHLDSLREPERFRAWLVAIATNRIRDHWRAVQAARSARESLHEGGTEDEAFADPGADFVDLTIMHLGLKGQRAEVAEATRWMDEDDRTLLSLWWLEAAGQLSRAEVTQAMDLSPQHTAVRVQRMKERLEASRAVVRALAHEPRCPGLDELVSRWDGTPSALWRKRLARHARACDACRSRTRGLVPAEGLLMGLALLPVAAGLARLAGTAAPDMALAATQQPADAGPAREDGTEHPEGTAHPGTGASPGPAGPTSTGSASPATAPRPRAPLVAACLVLLLAAGTAGLATLDRNTAPETSLRAVPAHSAVPRPEPTPVIGEAASAGATPRPSASPSVSPTRRPTPTPKPTRAPSYPERMLIAVNAERVKAGCAPVRAHQTLTRIAQAHSDDMATHGYFDHTDPAGLDSGDRIEASGYDADGYNENLSTYATPESAVKSWMSGGGHREAILDCDHQDAGIGFAEDSEGEEYWTLDLAHR
ncbi:sigma-70 family RNA polymerase sigma factor [Streptomyces sp. NPDC008265]|uniref:sigma-70 family RNA polymerase sigma factor n=1 Tax=Streptomyces sp. NPDC008265 TaxID=3364824 RepID=UPI0036EA4702